MSRSRLQLAKDLVTFPLRAVTLFDRNRWGLSSLETERFDYVAREIRGYCLDVGCGPHDRFIREFCKGHGRGIDAFPYPELKEESMLTDPAHFPFPDNTFETVTFIASINHIPRPFRQAEVTEAHRCVRPRGNIVVTMGNALAELLVHRLVAFYDRFLGTRFDVDGQRGMVEEEEYYLTDLEITECLLRGGFQRITKKLFLTQWGLNHLFVGWKGEKAGSSG